MTRHARWTDALAVLFVVLTVLVAGWYLWIWIEPQVPLNPFPPRDPGLSAPGPVHAARAASYRPAGPTPTFPPTWTPTVWQPTITPTHFPTSTPRPTLTPTPTSTPDPLRPYYIMGMRARQYPGGQVRIDGLFGSSSEFTTYLINYTSDGLRISGMMNVPKGKGPFPVIILCHGYIHPDTYATGNDTWTQADYLAAHGYLTISSDYRSHAGSDDGTSFFHIGYAQDVLNLIASLHTVEKADPKRIGLWGHSMGGGVALKAAVVSKKVDAVVLWAPVSADEGINLEYGLGNGPGGQALSAFGSPTSNRVAYKRISSINYLNLSPPLSIHHGKADTVVPYEWSEDLLQAAQKKGVTAELFLYPDAEHQLLDKDWELAMKRTLAFYDQYVKAGR